MSGHSKWAQIKRQKGVVDARRGQLFTKLANAITIAVREGGASLRLAIEKARASNMPKENVQRAIERGKGVGEKGALEEVVYEGFGPGGIAVVVECVTDSKQRTLSTVKSFFDKNGGTLGQPGSVSYQFKQVGQITVKKDNMPFDDIFEKAAESGAEDVEEAGAEAIVYTSPQQLSSVKDNLTQAGLTVIEAELGRKPTMPVSITDKETAGKVLSFVEGLENLDDVQKVYSNFDILEELIEKSV